MINLFLIKNKLKNKTNIQNNNNEIIEKLKCRYGFNIERKLYESKKL